MPRNPQWPGVPAAATFAAMFRLLRYPELDLAAWDACVAAAAPPVPYAYSWWLHATAGTWEALVAQATPGGPYQAVVPLPVKRRLLGREVYQPPFTQQLGLVSRPGYHAPAWPEALLRRRYAHIYLQGNDASRPGEALGAAGPPTQRHTYHLALAADHATLRTGYCADYRRRLRQLAAGPLRVEPVADAEPLLALFQATKGPAAGLRPRHYRRLRRLVAALAARQLLDLRAVADPATGQLLAGALFVPCGARVIYLFAAASAAGKKAGAPLLLLDDAIGRYAGTAGRFLDFEGGNIPALARFFTNFGATRVPYPVYSFHQRPWSFLWNR